MERNQSLDRLPVYFQVYWYESMIMAIMYLGYIVVMVVNPQLEKWAHATKKKLRTKVFPVQTVAASAGGPRQPPPPASESTPLHTSSRGVQVVHVVSAVHPCVTGCLRVGCFSRTTFRQVVWFSRQKVTSFQGLSLGGHFAARLFV